MSGMLHAFKSKRTSELCSGDIVNCHGLRCLIDGDLLVSRCHGDTPGVGDGKTRYTRALVLNRDDVPSDIVPRSWTQGGTPRGNDWPDDEHRWTIQGNDRATWAVEMRDERE